MPELPDIAAYIMALEAHILGQPIERVRLASVLLLRTVEPPLSSVEGRARWTNWKRSSAVELSGGRLAGSVEMKLSGRTPFTINA